MSFSEKILLYLLVLFVFVISNVSNTYAFEGHITFVQSTGYDTLWLKYSIKGDKIKISKYDRDNNLIQCLLVDISEEQVTAIDYQQKLYRPLDLEQADQTKKEKKYTILQTDNFREVNGVKCYQWRVRNRESNSEIAYWVTRTNFDFFHDLIRLLERSNKIYHFFSQIPANDGYFPMLAVERSLLRRERQRIAVTEIKHESLQDELFEIPKDCSLVKR